MVKVVADGGGMHFLNFSLVCGVARDWHEKLIRRTQRFLMVKLVMAKSAVALKAAISSRRW